MADVVPPEPFLTDSSNRGIGGPRHEGSAFLVVRLSALGDVIHTMPAVLALRQGLDAGARLGWVVESPYAELVAAVAPVDAVFRVATKRWRRKPFGPATWTDLRGVRRELRVFAQGQTAIDFQGLAKSAVLGFVSGARRRLGFDRDSVRESLASFLYSDRLRVDPSLHVVEMNLQLARVAGGRIDPVPQPDYSAFAVDRSGALAPLCREPFVVLLPGAGRPEKQWNIDRFGLLADRLTKLLGAKSIVVWGPGERRLAEAVATASGNAAVVAPPTDLSELAFLLRAARLVIGGDTGPLHLADAYGTPVIGLYGPTNPLRNGPYRQLRNCVESSTTRRRMDEISVEMVIRKVEEAMS